MSSTTIVRGYNIQLGYKEETTEGTMPDGTSTAPITYSYFGHVIGFTPTINPNPQAVQPIGQRYPLVHLKGTLVVDVSIEYYPILIDPMQYALSNVSKSITIWEKIIDINSSLIYTGLKCNRLRIKGEVGKPLTVTQDFVGKTVSTTPPSYASLPSVASANPMHFPDQNVTLSGSSLSGKVIGFEADISNNIEPIYQLGDATSVTKVERLLDVSGNITMTFSSISDLTDVLNLTSKTNLALILGKDSASTSRILTIPNIVWTSYPKPVRVGEILKITLPFKAQGSMPTLA